MTRAVAVTLTALLLLAGHAAMAAPPKAVQANRIGEMDRLILDTAQAAQGGRHPTRLYNDGAGYSIPDLPRGDSIIGLRSSGDIGFPLNILYMSIYDRDGYRSLNGTSTLYCNSSYNVGIPGSLPEPGY